MYLLAIPLFLLLVRNVRQLVVQKQLSLTWLFSTYWFVFLIGGLMFFKSEYDFALKPFLWVLCSIMLFTFGYKIVNKTYLAANIVKEENRTEIIKISDVSKNCFISILLIIFIFRVVVLCRQLIIYNISPFSLSAVFAFFREAKYGLVELSINNGFGLKIINVVFYVSIMAFGYALRYLNSKEKVGFTLLIFINSIVVVLLDGAKATLIFIAVLLMTGYLFDGLAHNRKVLSNIKLPVVILLGVGIVILLFLMMGSDFYNFKIYAFGEIPAFSEFFKIGPSERTFGKQTIYGLIKIFAPSEDFEGIHDNYPLIKEFAIDTNIFTAFRCAITDFGYLGGLVFYFVLGLIAGICKRNHKSLLSEMFISWLVGYILLSFLMSVGYYFTISLALILGPIAIRLMKRVIVITKVNKTEHMQVFNNGLI